MRMHHGNASNGPGNASPVPFPTDPVEKRIKRFVSQIFLAGKGIV